MKIGLLPLYITLYDKVAIHYRKRLEPFYDTIAKLFEDKGLEVLKSGFCMEEEDFEKAIAYFEAENCDAIVTLHTAYSPSLKSAKYLVNTKLPIIVCDTTEIEDFSDKQSPVEISYCHGIHGVMDMCNILKKNKKAYAIAAGHYLSSDVIDRVVGFVKAAKSSKALFGSNVGSIGGCFEGMGDFQVPDETLKEMFNVNVVYPKAGEIAEIAKSVTDEEIEAEKERHKKEYKIMGEFDSALYNNSVKADITLKKWIKKHNLQAFTINFNEIGELPTMTFHGICQAMSEGVGYAGEGDTLTALLSGALLQGYKDTSFVEIFCPDWKNDTAFISHMGEMNYSVADGPIEFFEKNFIGGGKNPITGTAAYRPGKAVFVNVFEDENGFNLLIAPATVIKETTDNFVKNIRGWLKFSKPLSSVLEKISEYGATHHSVLVYDATAKEMAFFAKCLNIKPIVLD